MPPIKHLNQAAGKAGWRVSQWSAETGVGKTTTHALIKDRIIESVKVAPKLRIITTSPAEYLARFKPGGDAQ
jgi:hypothetical protein